jgi:hypothetical protein
MREYSGFFGVIATFTIMDMAGDYIVERKFVFDSVWMTILISGLLVYITLRTLKKKTRLLHVEGR